MITASGILMAGWAMGMVEPASSATPVELLPRLKSFVESRIAEFAAVPRERRERLAEITRYAQACVDNGRPIRLTFVCTHNSRRSQLAQLWAEVAAVWYGVPDLRAFSGGTERTAFNPRAVEAARRAGFAVEKNGEGRNPVYHVRFSDAVPPLACFSKVHDEPPNPQESFCAVMVCSDADRACPSVPGAAARVAIPFEDPKQSDDTPREAGTYDERCAQIAREMLFALSEVRVPQRRAMDDHGQVKRSTENRRSSAGEF